MTETIEDYLRVIYHLQENNQTATTTALARELRVSPPTVTAMLKKLSASKLVLYQPYQPVELTSAGKQAALRIIRFHRLAETFLVQVLGVSWESVHAEAHKWEHVMTDDIAARLERLLGYPHHDPHGDPIPTADGILPHEQVLLSLAAVKAGQRVAVARILDESPALLEYLGSLGLYPGSEVFVVATAPFDGPITLRLGEREEIIGLNAATQVLVNMLG